MAMPEARKHRTVNAWIAGGTSSVVGAFEGCGSGGRACEEEQEARRSLTVLMCMHDSLT